MLYFEFKIIDNNVMLYYVKNGKTIYHNVILSRSSCLKHILNRAYFFRFIYNILTLWAYVFEYLCGLHGNKINDEKRQYVATVINSKQST